ncbi:MAG: transaldolase [Gemmatimonadota bacterium]|nr:transaldolase [Gemmatimonadota bacterium]
MYADGARLSDMLSAHKEGIVKGFTTNPTLMSAAGVTDYGAFSREVLAVITDLPISFEVFADDFEEMAAQARKIAKWGKNVYVKIPVTDTKGQSAISLIRELSSEGLKLNVTAIMTLEQTGAVADAIAPGTPAIISIFAGRIADTGRDPIPLMREAVEMCADRPHLEILWASPREVLNVYQADACGCHIITCTPDLIKKLRLRGKDLNEYSRETVQMFFDDGRKAKLSL